MAVKEVACPYCGKKVNVTLPEDKNIETVRKQRISSSSELGLGIFLNYKGNYIDAGHEGEESSHSFYVYYEG